MDESPEIELDETWTADAVTLAVRPDPESTPPGLWILLASLAVLGVVAAMAVAGLILGGALGGPLAWPVAAGMIGALVLSFVGFPLGLVTLSLRYRRAVPLRIGPEAIEIDGRSWSTGDIDGVSVGDDRRVTVLLREGEPWVSHPLTPEHARRVAELLQAAIPSDEELEEAEALEARMRRKLAALRTRRAPESR